MWHAHANVCRFAQCQFSQTESPFAWAKSSKKDLLLNFFFFELNKQGRQLCRHNETNWHKKMYISRCLIHRADYPSGWTAFGQTDFRKKLPQFNIVLVSNRVIPHAYILWTHLKPSCVHGSLFDLRDSHKNPLILLYFDSNSWSGFTNSLNQAAVPPLTCLKPRKSFHRKCLM